MCIDKVRERDKRECGHILGRHLAPFNRFLAFFWRRDKLMDTYTYTAVCPDCGILLCVPKVFMSTELKLSFGLTSALLEVILIFLSIQGENPIKVFVLGQCFIVVLTTLIVRSVPTAILAFGRWNEQQPMNDVLLRYYNDPNGHKQRTFGVIMSSVSIAMMIPLGCYFYIPFSAMLAIFNVLIGIIAKEKKNLKVGLCVLLCALILLISCFTLQSNIALFIITGIGLVICFIALFFIFKYLDNRRKKNPSG